MNLTVITSDGTTHDIHGPHSTLPIVPA
ncbi:hypothetical protein SBA4_2280008 [Candidatus Sulfopaludibacter sp. SbA4]|nr:hypothetical protein SBA4_2280008 [Candidatus Sulfopaludibacter sp. SbA4]